MNQRSLRAAELLGRSLAIYIAIDPIYDWLSGSVLNNVLGVIRLSDVLSLSFLAVFTLLVRSSPQGWRGLDSYAWSLILLTLYRIFVDLLQVDTSVGDDVPRMALNLVIYVAATKAIVSRKEMLHACAFSLFIYYVGCIAQLPSGGFGQRFSSIYLIPNFLAFNAINIFVLIRALQIPGWWSNFLALSAFGLILLSKTRTVLMTMVFFYKIVRSISIRFLIVALVLVFSIVGAGESVRISGEVDDFWNFDGRVPIWTAIIDRFDDFNLILGSGTDALRRFEVFVMYDEQGDQMGYLKAQNHYLQTLVEVGVIGCAIWLFGIFSYLRKLFRSRSWNVSSNLGFAFVAALLVIQLFENDIFVNPTVSLVLGLLVSKYFVFARR